jgi:hypothetical protein
MGDSMNPCDHILARLRAGHALDADAATHVTGCALCRDAVALLRLLPREHPADLDGDWSRVQARLEAGTAPESVTLRRPPLGWRVALALAAGAGSLLLVPEPMQVLIVLGVL